MKNPFKTSPTNVSLASNSQRTLATILNYFLFSIFAQALVFLVTSIVSKDVVDLTGVMIILSMFIYVYFESALGGTPGKLLLKMRVVDANTFEKISYKRAVMRTFRKFIQLTGIFSLIGTLFNTAKNRFPHDELTETLVINSNE